MNLRYLEEFAELDPWVFGSKRLKEELSKNETVTVPAVDQWRVSYLRDLLEQRQRLHHMGDNQGGEGCDSSD